MMSHHDIQKAELTNGRWELPTHARSPRVPAKKPVGPCACGCGRPAYRYRSGRPMCDPCRFGS